MILRSRCFRESVDLTQRPGQDSRLGSSGLNKVNLFEDSQQFSAFPKPSPGPRLLTCLSAEREEADILELLPCP